MTLVVVAPQARCGKALFVLGPQASQQPARFRRIAEGSFSFFGRQAEVTRI